MPSVHKTVLRSIRVPAEVSEVLATDAQSKGVSVNALVSSVLKKYIEWDRYADRFGFVTITAEGYRWMHERIPDKDLERLGAESGSVNPKEVALFFFKRLGPDTFVRYAELMSRYAGWCEVEVLRDPATTTVVFRHGLGKKYSRFLTAWLGAAATAIARVPARVESHGGSVIVHLAAR